MSFFVELESPKEELVLKSKFKGSIYKLIKELCPKVNNPNLWNCMSIVMPIKDILPKLREFTSY